MEKRLNKCCICGREYEGRDKINAFRPDIFTNSEIRTKQKMEETLHLPLKKEWYDLIERGIKTEEYREIKPYWTKRLMKRYCQVQFTYGYTNRTMTFEIESITIDKGKSEWGAETGKRYYVIKLGKRVTNII